MTIMPKIEFERLERLRFNIRRQRCMRDWTAKQLADEANKAAKRRGIDLKLKLYSITSLETGRMKSEPVWAKYVLYAFEDNPVEIEGFQSVPKNEKSEEIKKECDKVLALPDPPLLKKILIGLLGPIEIGNSLESKLQLADILSQRLPIGVKHGQSLFE